jgi:hypothetical protein
LNQLNPDVNEVAGFKAMVALLVVPRLNVFVEPEVNAIGVPIFNNYMRYLIITIPEPPLPPVALPPPSAPPPPPPVFAVPLTVCPVLF